ncbi:MAG: Ppx/GppA phosphatase family protein [Nitrospirota bacterium]
MPLFASIDLGSNTIRLLIGKIDNHGLTDIYYGRQITRLGSGLHETGRLRPENMEASLTALREFSSLIDRYGVLRVRTVATSALREASNSAEFLQKVASEIGLEVEVISGEREADLTLKGILFSFVDTSYMKNPLFIVDIGGGSTEWILYKHPSAVDMGSIPLGVIKLAETAIRTDPVSKHDIREFKEKTIPFMHSINDKIGHHLKQNTSFVGTGGTFTTIASVDLELEMYSREKVHLHRIALERLLRMSAGLSSLSLQERRKIRGLEPERADLIIPGLLLTINMMEFLNFEELIISEYGILEGVLLEIKETSEEDISETKKS